MKMRTGLSAVAVALMAMGGVAAADSHHGNGGQPAREAGGGNHDMMQKMMRMHSRMTGDDSSISMMGGGMMQGGMGGGMSMMGPMRAMLDADGDGAVTPEEARDGLQALLTEYDGDGDEALSLAEFEILHSAIIRETMVDRFQFLDDDGDGRVTATEIVKPANHMERMQTMRERMMQGDGMMDAPGEEMMGGDDEGMTDDD